MGLDLYAGTLGRYYAGQWETAAARYSREHGIAFSTIRPTGTPNTHTAPADAVRAVVAWRTALSTALGQHIEHTLDWPEGLEPPYFSDKPDWDGLGGLLLWGVYAEHPGMKRPDRYVRQWQDEAALKAAKPEASRYVAVLGCGLWLPGTANMVFETVDVAGQTVSIGFTSALQAALADLNARTWKADASMIAAWRARGPVRDGEPFEHQAQFGFAVFHQTVFFAVTHGLPIKTDY